MNKTHKLKILPLYFKEAKNGRKYFEIRKNDRDFHAGDYIILNEFDGDNYTGRKIEGRITYITDFEQQDGYIVFGWQRAGFAMGCITSEQSQNRERNDKLYDLMKSEISDSIRKSMNQAHSFLEKGRN